jgi:tRNA(adenine34) deaminase
MAAAIPGKSDQAIHLEMMQQSLRLAHKAAEAGEVPVGAVVFRGENILGQAFNRREVDADPTAHAEILAMREAARRVGNWRLDGCSLAVTLEPCPMCAGAMVNARIEHVIYGCKDPNMGCVDSLHRLCDEPRFNHRMKITAGVLERECGQILKTFFAARRGPAAERPPKPRPLHSAKPASD